MTKTPNKERIMTKATKTDVYQVVTDRIIEALESGTVPWQKPWRSLDSLPYNLRTKKAYRGINVFLLHIAGYDDPRWGTYKAIKDSGGQVRKGEKGTTVILWKPVRKTEEVDGEQRDRSFMLLRSYTVFNAEQADGLPELPKDEVIEFTPSEAADALIEAYGNRPAIHHGKSRAAYSILADSIDMPNPEDFNSSEDYYLTLFHELTHSSGSEHRLNRLVPATFGSEPYGKEELVAEMGAAMMAGLSGMDFPEQNGNQAAYIASWLTTIKGDIKLVVQAAAQAQKAVDHMVGKTFEDEKTEGATDDTVAQAA